MVSLAHIGLLCHISNGPFLQTPNAGATDEGNITSPYKTCSQNGLQKKMNEIQNGTFKENDFSMMVLFMRTSTTDK